MGTRGSRFAMRWPERDRPETVDVGAGDYAIVLDGKADISPVAVTVIAGQASRVTTPIGQVTLSWAGANPTILQVLRQHEKDDPVCGVGCGTNRYGRRGAGELPDRAAELFHYARWQSRIPAGRGHRSLPDRQLASPCRRRGVDRISSSAVLTEKAISVELGNGGAVQTAACVRLRQAGASSIARLVSAVVVAT